MRRTVTSVAAVAMLVVTALAVACAPTGPAPVNPPPASSLPATRSMAPGISEWAGGSVEAAGWVVWEDLEGGFWALQDVPPSTSSVRQPKIVAVLLPGAVTAKVISGFEGRYAIADGRIQGGASVRMAGPELVVDRIASARTP
jgi:hypothetical protein